MAIYTIADLHLSINDQTNKSMEVFGSRWNGYVEKLENHWRNTVKPEDTVIIPGDISWALALDEAKQDLCFLDALPGNKLIGKGNHDFWWSTASKIHAFFKENDIDTVIVFGGTNDSWIDAPLGKLKFDNFEESDFYSVCPAICYLMGKIKADLPKARILFVANSDIKEEIINCIKVAGEHYGVDTIALHDVRKESGHPTPLGMTDICEQVLEWWNKT